MKHVRVIFCLIWMFKLVTYFLWKSCEDLSRLFIRQWYHSYYLYKDWNKGVVLDLLNRMRFSFHFMFQTLSPKLKKNPFKIIHIIYNKIISRCLEGVLEGNSLDYLVSIANFFAWKCSLVIYVIMLFDFFLYRGFATFLFPVDEEWCRYKWVRCLDVG